jgi:hypothetical protein
VLKNRASRRDPALCGFCKCSHIAQYAALSKTPHALADGLMLAFQYPDCSFLLKWVVTRFLVQRVRAVQDVGLVNFKTNTLNAFLPESASR